MMEYYRKNKSKLKIFSFSKRVKTTCFSVFPTNNCQGTHFHLIKLKFNWDTKMTFKNYQIIGVQLNTKRQATFSPSIHSKSTFSSPILG